MANKLGFAVVEGVWNHKVKYSIRPIFDLVSHQLSNKIDNYDYQKVIGKQSFFEVLKQLKAERIPLWLISCHGEKGQFWLKSFSGKGEAVPVAALRPILAKSPPTGIYLDACALANRQNAKVILSSGVSWVAGYGKDADWWESMSICLLFWTIFAAEQGNVTKTAGCLKRKCAGLAKDLSFRIYVVRKGQMVNLMQ